MHRVLAIGTLALAPLTWAGCTLLLDSGYTGGSPDAGPPAEAGAGMEGGGSVEAGPTDASIDAPIEAATPTYASAVLADAPLSYWRFEETTGIVFKDEMGKHDLSGVDAEGLELGGTGVVRGRSLHLDGKRQLLLAGTLDWSPGKKFTIETWLRPEATDDNYRRIFAKVTIASGGPRDGSYLWVNAQRRAVGWERWNDGVGTEATYWDERPSATAFTHLVVVVNNELPKLYVNGAPAGAGSADQPNNATDPDAPVTIGFNFLGAIDEFAYYDKPLSAERIKAHFDAALADPP